MPTVIILSSSPPPVFARSPTPADPSSSRNNLDKNPHNETPSRKRFKPTEAKRDGFKGGFSTARQVLAEKNGELNKLISSSPGRNKFKTAPETVTGTSELLEQGEECASGSDSRDTVQEVSGRSEEVMHAAVNLRQENPTSSPMIVQRAVSRRKDWTPPRPDTVRGGRDTSVLESSGFPNGLLADFAYSSNTTDTSAFVTEANKRRRVAPAEAKDVSSNMKRLEGVAGQTEQGTSTKRNKSPTKKSLTITGLATANYIGQVSSEDSPMLQYLTSTQQQVPGVASCVGGLDTKVKQTKAAAAKIKDSKKNQPKSSLVSPSSALKYLEEQETVFGSASQLWTAEPNAAAKQARLSDSFSFSDAFSSPPPSQAKSVESRTPQTGISRFKRSRNLWAAAGRDEDNALLHIDTVDLTDSPGVRAALAGKDVMVQSNTERPKPTSAVSTRQASLAPQPSIQRKRLSVLDIDDIVTPGQSPSTLAASFHTSAQTCEPRRKSPLSAANDQATKAVSAKASKTTVKKSQPKKPHFAGLSDHDLKKQISAYGFKAIKKREKMIDLLEKCWTEKYGTAERTTTTEAEKSGYGDILSHIHDVSARPVPKEKKVAKPRKKKDDASSKTTIAKKPRQRKTKSPEEKGTESGAKTVRKRKSKANVVSEEFVYDIEDLNDPAVKERRELGRFDDWAAPPKTPKIQELLVDHGEPPTPPLSYHEMPEQSAAASEQHKAPSLLPDISEPKSTKTQEKTLATPDDSQQPDISGQITRAINHESFTSNVCVSSPSKPSSSSATTARRNHQANPTWHEKILMYDPIVLEDLATWLNTKGLSDIGEDREVSAVEVRTWCESRGICCLWKGGWRGVQGSE